jgi:hypothetical protein
LGVSLHDYRFVSEEIHAVVEPSRHVERCPAGFPGSHVLVVKLSLRDSHVETPASEVVDRVEVIVRHTTRMSQLAVT